MWTFIQTKGLLNAGNVTRGLDGVSIWKFTAEHTLVINPSLAMYVEKRSALVIIFPDTGKFMLATDVTNALTVIRLSFRLQT